jgi:hypothetical protein
LILSLLAFKIETKILFIGGFLFANGKNYKNVCINKILSIFLLGTMDHKKLQLKYFYLKKYILQPGTQNNPETEREQQHMLKSFF